MFRRILIPLDGSARAESALPVAARLARAYGGSLILVEVIETSRDYGAYLQPLIDEEKAAAREYLEAIAKAEHTEGLESEIKVLTGAVGSTILETVRTSRADLIVMCSHGYTGVQNWMLGSIAEKVARHSAVPVLILRESAPLASLPLQQPVRALVPLDGSPFSEAALEPAASLVAELAASIGQAGELHLLRVNDLPLTGGRLKSQAMIDSQTREQARQQAQDYLEKLSARLQEAEMAELNITVTFSVVGNPDVAGAIIRKAEGAGADAGSALTLIAMATHGRGGMSQFVLGSVTERVLHHTKLPLLVVRPPKRAQESARVDERAAEDREEQGWVGMF